MSMRRSICLSLEQAEEWDQSQFAKRRRFENGSDSPCWRSALQHPPWHGDSVQLVIVSTSADERQSQKSVIWETIRKAKSEPVLSEI